MSRFITCQTGSVCWQVKADWWAGAEANRSAQLFGPEGLRLEEWLLTGQARVVKKGLHRTVYHVVLPGLDIHLKHYPLTDTRSWLRQLIRPSKARSEYQLTLAVAERNVATLEPLAFGECGSTIQASYLITRTVPHVHSLDQFMEQTLLQLPLARQTQTRQVLAEELGIFVARMHHAGITHKDLHPGNLLVRLDEFDCPRLYLIDLHALHIGGALSWSASRDNLVLFNRWFILRAERSDRMRFFKSYVQARKSLTGSDRQGFSFVKRFRCPPGAERELEERTVVSNLDFWRHHDPRCVGANRYFRRLASGKVRGHAVADLDAGLVAELLADPDAPFRWAGVRFLKNSRSSTVIEIEAPSPEGPRRLIYKRFNMTRWTDPVTALFRWTGVVRSYRMGHALRWRGLPTPRPLLMLQRHIWGLPRQGYILTENLPEARHLFDFVHELSLRRDAERQRCLRAMITQLGRLISDLHQRRILHRDLKAANLLVSSQPWRVSHPDRRDYGSIALPAVSGPGTPQLWLIDLVGVTLAGKRDRRQCVKNLARLHASFWIHQGVTRTDKLRFLRIYLRWGLRGKMGWKRWWRAIEQATQIKVRRNLRRGRPLA